MVNSAALAALGECNAARGLRVAHPLRAAAPADQKLPSAIIENIDRSRIHPPGLAAANFKQVVMPQTYTQAQQQPEGPG